MGIDFTPRESRALYRMLAESPDDIVLKTDRRGFIVHASPSIRRLGFPPQEMLIWPHVLDLVRPGSAPRIEAHFRAAIAGSRERRWIEFPAAMPDASEQWFEIRFRPLVRSDHRIYGALGVMRSIEQRKSLEERLFAAELTDALTGLTNRRAFMAMLQHLVQDRSGGCLALFDIDYFKCINWRFGHSTGDQVLVVFSDLLRTLMRHEDIISRIGARTLGVLLPNTKPDRAVDACRRIIDVLSEIRATLQPESLAITASAGVSRIGRSCDDTVRRAEFALFIARAKGRNCLELDEWTRSPWRKDGRARLR